MGMKKIYYVDKQPMIASFMSQGIFVKTNSV